MRYEYRGLRKFVNFGDDISLGLENADYKSMKLAMEVVTAEHVYLRANRRYQYP